MTELEQKAEEYFSHHNFALHNRYGVQKDIHRMIYEDGYEQGQQEEHNKWCSNPTWVLQLENENTKLKLKITRLKNIIKNTYKGIHNQSELLKDILEELEE